MARIRISSAQQLYVAFYGRPGDPAGLAFWETQVSGNGSGQTNYAGIANAFGNSEEAFDRFGSLSFPDAVNVLFNSILGRNADPEGLNFFVGELNAGRITLAGLALAIVEGIEEGSSDAAVFNNKTLAANRFTAALDTPQKLALYDFENNPVSLQIALDFLDNITSSPLSVPSSATVQQIVNSLGSTGINNPPQILSGPFLLDETTISFAALDTDSSNLTARVNGIFLGIVNNGTETFLSVTPQSSTLSGRLTVFDGINSTDLETPIGIGTNVSDNILVAFFEPVLIYGFGGDDTLTASRGDDFIFGGFGNDDLFGNEGSDILIGDEGNDEIFGELGNDSIFGGIGDDFLVGGDGDDLIFGNDGDDWISILGGNSTVDGGSGDDIILGTIRGEQGSKVIIGGAGNDFISGGLGTDWISGGSGNDTFSYSVVSFLLDAPFEFSDRAFALGGDIITDFEGAGFLGGDVLNLSEITFGISAELFFFGNDFSSVVDDRTADRSTSKIVFSRNSGNLFYNDSALIGDSVLIVTLEGVNNLNVDDFAIVA